MTDADKNYKMRISRTTIDKLGVKLYDKASAVVAELIANGYDADAEEVIVRLPLNSALATKKKDGTIDEKGYIIEVIDDGHGMTPEEAQMYFLDVGRDRRRHTGQGATSREKDRPVMGRKGIGKLAPFGICKRIEVVSAGGKKTSKGYLVSNFTLDYDKIITDGTDPVDIEAGLQDRTYSDRRGTTIRLSIFLPKVVPDSATFHRQLAARFIFARPDFKITVEDMRDSSNLPSIVQPLDVPIIDGTKIELADRPVKTVEGDELPVKGWLALAKDAYKNEEMAGVRIYARNKIVATTRDFEQPAGFTGEFTIRSYLVGEVVAEWLDKDNGDDLVRSDRQGILWESEYGRALREWGASIIKEIGKRSAKPRRDKKSKMFIEQSQFRKRAEDRFDDSVVVDVAVEFAKQIGAFAAEDELADSEYVEDLAEIILSVAPHKALMEAFRDFSKTVAGGEVSLEKLLDLFGKTRIAEMASYGQIAAERVQAVKELEKIVKEDLNERAFQTLLESAPWLIEPTWSVITKNQALKTFKNSFEAFYKKKYSEEITLSIGYETKQPDFILVNVGHMLHIVEIKKAGYEFADSDFDRLANYVDAFRTFFSDNPKLAKEFSNGWRIDLVADGIEIKDFTKREAYGRFEELREVRRTSWNDFLTRAVNAHEQFLEAFDEAVARRGKLDPTT